MSPTKTVLVFVGGTVVGAVAILQLRENETSCCERVGWGAREELVTMAGPLGGVVGAIYDALNLRSVAGPLLDALGVPKNA